MTRLVNRPEDTVREMLEGYAAAYRDTIALTPDLIITRRTPKPPGRVGLVIGNGSGHEPAMIGWVGHGLFDVNVPGEIFTAPDPDRMLAGIRLADRGAGVLLCVSSHAGDIMNAELALNMAKEEGLHVEMVRLYDDVASAPKGQESRRRGTAGLFFVWKVVGALAESTSSLRECVAMAERVRDNTRTLSMAVKAGTHPLTGEPMFELPPDEIEIGLGVHGEPGRGRMKRLPADGAVDAMAEWILDDKPFVAGDEVLVLLNNSGGMTLLELFIAYRRLDRILSERGVGVHRTWIGSYATTQDMAGFAVSLCKVDNEIKQLYDAPANAPYFKQLGMDS
jgi:dihydroxyacetone kinase-like protein